MNGASPGNQPSSSREEPRSPSIAARRDEAPADVASATPFAGAPAPRITQELALQEFKEQFSRLVAECRVSEALALYEGPQPGYNQLLAKAKEEISFNQRCIKLLQLMLDPWSDPKCVDRAPDFAKKLFPLPDSARNQAPELEQQYSKSLADVFGEALARGKWRIADRVLKCELPNDFCADETSSKRFAQHLRRHGRGALSALLDGLSDKEMAWRCLSELAETRAARGVFQKLFPQDRRAALGITEQVDEASRRLIREATKREHSLSKDIETIATITALYAVLGSEEPGYRRAKVWVEHKLPEMVAELWHLSVFGGAKPLPRELRTAGPKDFRSALKILPAASETFRLDARRCENLVSCLTRWQAEYILKRGVTPDPAPSSWLQRFVESAVERTKQRQWVDGKLGVFQTAFRSGESLQAFIAATELFDKFLSDPKFRATAKYQQFDLIAQMVAGSTPTAKLAEGMILSALLREAQSDAPDRVLIAIFASVLSRGKKIKAGRMRALKRLAEAVPNSEEALLVASSLKPRSLGRL